MRRVRVLGAAILAAVVCALAACSAESEAVVADGPAPSELRLAIGGEPDDGFDPTLGWGRYGSPLFQSTLLRLDADLNVIPDLATDYEVSDDGLTWTVKIREDALFHDGSPVTATDVAYTYQTAMAEGGLVDVQALSSVQATDASTVEIVLKEPRSNFVYQMSTLGIVPAHAHDADYKTHPVGSGPFTFVQWDAGQQLIVERFDDYYGELPEFERIVFVFSDEDGALAGARTGQVEVAGVSSALATADIPGFEVVAVPSLDNRGISLPYVADTGETTASGAPIGNDVTSDRAIRQALSFGVDREELVEGILEGYGSPASGPVDGAPWYEPESAIVDNDPDRARRILADGGWVVDEDGIQTKDGVKAEFTLLYPASDSLRQGLALAVADQLRPLGIHITAEGVTWEQLGERMHSDAVMFGWGSHDPIETYYIYASQMAGVDYFNPGYYSNPVVDEHFRTALTSRDMDDALAAWRAAQLDDAGEGYSTQGDAAWTWLVNVDHTYYVNECLDLGSVQIEPHGHGWPITAGIVGWAWTC